MRAVRNRQMQLGKIGIAQTQFNSQSQDGIPKVLRGLQHLNEVLREQIFVLLENEIAHLGWTNALVVRAWGCGVLHLDLNIDYECLLEPDAEAWVV